MVWKDRKEFTADMKHIYTAPTKEAAKAALEDFADKWEHKYLYAIQSWRNNWDELTIFLTSLWNCEAIVNTFEDK
ncbi:hypothetical protein BPO_p0122 (plasmid) [Bergeyella porcorum]|uniref:Mutator family transposase n=1 Tax=Bergeyella porcorum TaxID=1735111 RepID=A0AAU0F5P4_9FLAO